MKNSVEIKKLNKKYSNFKLNNINLNIPSGQIIGLIGENGAGKTTMIKSILNIISFDGNIKIFGNDNVTNETVIKENIGVVLDNSFFPELLCSNDIDKIMSNIYKNWDSKMFYNYLNDFGIPVKQFLKTLSKGMRKKVEIASALSHHPKLLILDEPTSGLDPVVRSEILDIFQDFIVDDDHTIILSTHITSDLEKIADFIIFMDNGKIIFDKTRDDVLDNYGIIKCTKEEFDKIDNDDYVSYRKNKFNIEVLVSNREKMKKKYKYIIDKASLEDIMILYIKGEK